MRSWSILPPAFDSARPIPATMGWRRGTSRAQRRQSMDLGQKKGRYYYVANCMVNRAGSFQPPFYFYADSRDEALDLIRTEFLPRGILPAGDGRSYLTEFLLQEVNQELRDLSSRVSKSSQVHFTHIRPDGSAD